MTSSITASGRNFFLASALSAALLLAAPAISQAAEGFTINTSGTTASSTTQSGFGTTAQGLLPSSTVTLYVWTNQASGGFANSSTRRIAFDLNFNTAVFEQSGGSCSSQTPAAGFTYRGALSYSGSGNRTCTVILRVKPPATVATARAAAVARQREQRYWRPLSPPTHPLQQSGIAATPRWKRAMPTPTLSLA